MSRQRGSHAIGCQPDHSLNDNTEPIPVTQVATAVVKTARRRVKRRASSHDTAGSIAATVGVRAANTRSEKKQRPDESSRGHFREQGGQHLKHEFRPLSRIDAIAEYQRKYDQRRKQGDEQDRS